MISAITRGNKPENGIQLEDGVYDCIYDSLEQVQGEILGAWDFEGNIVSEIKNNCPNTHNWFGWNKREGL